VFLRFVGCNLPAFLLQYWQTESKVGEKVYTKEQYIAVFDSGVGGISVLKELVKLMPDERYLYFGDSANAPYGGRSTEEVRQLTLEAAQKLLDRGIKALVVACNTATAAAINDLRQAYPDLIIIGIEPALKLAADRFPGGRVGVMATPVTLREEKFNQQVERFPNIKVSTIPVPALVELVEQGHRDDEKIESLLRPALEPYAGELDAVVLGCTHYPFAANVISRILGKKTAILDGGAGTARETRRRLEMANLLYEGPGLVQMENSTQDPKIIEYAMALLEESRDF
jgi:glutamate racemase